MRQCFGTDPYWPREDCERVQKQIALDYQVVQCYMGDGELVDLSNIDELRQVCSDVLENAPANSVYVRWGNNLREFLAEVRAADHEVRASEKFQRRIWEDNPVSSVGRGYVRVDAAIDDPEFRNWLAEQSMERLPDAPESRKAALDTLYRELKEKVRQYTSSMPLLKIYRVLAGFFPSDFTTVANIEMTRNLHKAMFGDKGGAEPSCHARILQRLDEVRGAPPAKDDIDAIVDRMRLPWLLHKHFFGLSPLPAAERVKGLTSVSGGRDSLLKILNFCRDGTTRKDLMRYVKTVNPELKENSITTQFNGIASGLNCLNRDGHRVVLTDQGHAFLESEDPEELMEWLVTGVLGIDHALVILRDDGNCPSQELARRVQTVNPGWTRPRTPSVIVSILREFEMLDIDENNVLSLTDAGRKWSRRIHWQPEALPPVAPEPVSVQVPKLAGIRRKILESGHFPDPLMRKLHFGLWTNERRHFAVLTGLSGSGKTLLARAYGNAISVESGGSSRHLLTLPVQPGWYDPSALLGYVNPLQGSRYIRTPFLEFLIAASEAPERPFTAVLDEMNLSRPEQYLAPILSAMETGEALTLYSEGELFEGVPPEIRYPSNLAIIGTVNMDETTHGISDKVLDRAFTIEFWDVDLERYPSWGKRDISNEHEQAARSLLTDLMTSLRPARLHFGWRVVDDVLDYTDRVMADGDAPDLAAILDDVVYAKVLPKLRGDDSPRFREALRKSAEVLNEHGLDSCVRKVKELSEDLESTGSARFWR